MPGPVSPFCPSFPEDFLDRARRAIRCGTTEHRLVQRFQLALLLDLQPLLPNETAGARVGLSGRQVRRWRQRWAAGDFGVDDLPGRGRKARFSPPG
jgi:Homeodomain-like domain